MPLFLTEAAFDGSEPAGVLQRNVDRIRQAVSCSGGRLVEVHVGRDLHRLYVIVEHTDDNAVKRALAAGGFPGASVKPARIVGADLEGVRVGGGRANYLVEWNLPPGLTMDAYIKRKIEKSVNYASVPEVTFKRTYVCEDMSKCLCLYDAPDLAAVLRARQAVEAGVDGVTPVEPVIPAGAVVKAQGDS
jgi:hypothetical protein